MKGTIKNNQFSIFADVSYHAKFSNFTVNGESFTNAAGITSIGSRIYCLKANSSNKSGLAYTDSYQKTVPKSMNIILNAHCIGLTSNNQQLVTLGITANKEWKVFTIDKDSHEIQEYSFDKTAGRTYAGITHVSGNSYYTCYSTNGNKTLLIKRFNIGTSGITVTEEYPLINDGYTEMIQDIFYKTGFGLFIATNQKKESSYSPCKNTVLLYDLKNRPNTAFRAKMRFIFDFNTTIYKQFNVESLCLVDKKLVLIANVGVQSGQSAQAKATSDTFFSMNNATFDPRGTVITEWPVKKGREFAVRPITDTELVDPADKPILQKTGQSLRIHQSLSFASGKVYGMMVATADHYVSRNYSGLFYMPDYMNRSIPAKGNTKYLTFNRYTKNLSSNKEDPKNLYHCNSLNYDGKYFYVGCCESLDSAKTDENGEKYFTIVKMSLTGEIVQRYRFEERTNCIIPYKDGKFIIISAEVKYPYKKESLIRLHVGSFHSDGRFHSEEKFYLRNTVDTTEALQDACYYKSLGLFAARFNANKTHNSLLHYDLTKYVTDIVSIDGTDEKVKILLPDYALHVETAKSGDGLETIEFESPTVDETAGKLIVGCNARGPAGSDCAGSYDCILQYKDLSVSLS